MEKKLRLGLVWGQRSGAMKAQIATAKFAEFTFSRDCLESPNGLHFVAPLACTTVRNGTFLGASRCQRTRHSTRTGTFQTVSLRTPVNKAIYSTWQLRFCLNEFLDVSKAPPHQAGHAILHRFIDGHLGTNR